MDRSAATGSDAGAVEGGAIDERLEFGAESLSTPMLPIRPPRLLVPRFPSTLTPPFLPPPSRVSTFESRSCFDASEDEAAAAAAEAAVALVKDVSEEELERDGRIVEDEEK